MEIDALAVYKKDTDVFDIYAVPEAMQMQAAWQVADLMLERML